MELLSIFEMVKTDRYTMDGRDKIACLLQDARRTYNPGEISPTTGLEKQDDGSWAPPKNGGAVKEIKHGDVFTNKNGDVARIRDEGALGIIVDIKRKGEKSAKNVVVKTLEKAQELLKQQGITEYHSNSPKGALSKLLNNNNTQTKAQPNPAEKKPTKPAGTQPNPAQKTTTATKPAKPPLTGETKISITPTMKAELKKLLSQPAAKPEAEKSETSAERPTVTNGFESWQGIKELDKKLLPKWRQLRGKMKDSEYDAVKTWKEIDRDPYLEIQAYTRDPVNYSHMKNGQQVRDLTKEQVEGIVKNLDTAFKKAPAVGSNLTVVSGQSDRSLFYNAWGIKERNTDKLAEALKKHVGETLTNKSYLSAAVNEKGARAWHKRSDIEVRIDVPKDKKAIYLGNMEEDDYKGEDPKDDGNENELFINRGAKYRLDEVKVGRNRGGKKAVLVRMTLVGDGTEK